MSELADLPAGTCCSTQFGHIATSANQMATFPNTKVVSVLTVQNNNMASTIEIHRLLSFNGAWFTSCLSSQPSSDWPLNKLITLRPFHKPLLMIWCTCAYPRVNITAYSQNGFNSLTTLNTQIMLISLSLRRICMVANKLRIIWYQHLVCSLIAWGFHQSTSDPCLFICHNCIIVLYMDDCCIFAPSDAVIDAHIKSLKSKFVLEDQGPIKDYLGICIDQQINPKTNFIKCMILTQVGLINHILNDLGFFPNGTYPLHEQVKMHSTPMEEVLHL